MAIGFTQYNRPLRNTATGTQGSRRPMGPTGGQTAPPLTPESVPATPNPPVPTPTPTPTPRTPTNFTTADAMEGRLRAGQPATPAGTGFNADDWAAFLAGADDFNVETPSYGGSGESSADRLARTGATNQNAYFQALLAQAPGQYQGLRDLLASQRAEREAAVNAGIEAQRAALTGRYTTAQADVAKAYDDLRAALEANAPRAYANLPRATAPELAPDVVSQYARAVGAPTQAIAEAAVQEAARSVGTGESYNRLLANLRANEEAQQASRLAGVGMGRTSATSNLTALRQASLDRIEAQKQAALNQILAEIQQGQFGIAQGQLGYEQGLRQALAGLYGTGYVAPTGV